MAVYEFVIDCLNTGHTFSRCSSLWSKRSHGTKLRTECNAAFLIYISLFFPVTPKCVHDGKEFLEGDVYRMDPCWLCQCRGGISFCSKAECAELDCENFYIPEGECCPVCLGKLPQHIFYREQLYISLKHWCCVKVKYKYTTVSSECTVSPDPSGYSPHPQVWT